MDATTGLLPPFSHTGVEPSAVSVGWWAGTREIWDGGQSGDGEQAAAWDLFRRVQAIAPGGSNLRARSQWYQRSFSRDDGTATVYYAGVGSARGSIMLTLRQSWFESVPALAVADLLGLVQGLRVSRLDLAADVSGDRRLTPRTLYGQLPAARSRSRPANRVLTVAWDGAEKLTIGSRASDRYLRIYVKGERVRHEVECKGDVARAAWAAIAAGAGLESVWRDQYGRVVEWA